MNTLPAFFIVSAALTGDCPRERHDRTDTLERQLRANGLATARCKGCYKGETEPSILVIDENPATDKCERVVLRYGILYGQESILSVDCNRAATLIYCMGGSRVPLGKFTPVDKSLAEKYLAYTERDGQYYVCH